MGGKSKKVTVGYWYYATIKAGLAIKLDEVYKILVGDKVAWAGQAKSSHGNQSIYINAPYLFGGEKAEGGIQGSLEIRFGDENQQPSGHLRRLLGNIPADRGYVSTVFDGKLTALNPYPKPWVYCVRRYSSSFYPEKSLISLASGAITAMNPAHMLWESYTDEEWGRGLAPARLDSEAFKKVADTLYSEGFGLCLAWKVTDELKNFRQQVCDHIGAKLFTARNGLITIKLIRDDYKVDDLPVFDENSGLLKLEYDNTNNTTVPSKIVVTYKDALTFKERPAMAVNLAVAQSQGGQSVQTLDFKGLPTGELATRVAYRELKIRTSSLKRFNLELDRRAFDLDIGDVFVVRKVNTIVRVERIEEQFLTDGTIKINAIQDLYGLPKVAFNPTPPIENTDPDNTPVPIEQYLIVEVPYRELSGLIDQANLSLLDETTSYIMVIAASPKGTCRNYNLASRIQGTSQFNIAEPAGDWCPTAIITHELGYLDKTTQLADAVLLEDVEIGTAAIINDEIVRIDQINLSNSTITVGRGCADTVPHKHAAGSRIWFYDGFETSDTTEYNPNLIIETKLVSNTYIGQLELSDAPTEVFTIKGRQGRPYAPGNLKINGKAYPTAINTNNITISWSHRDRLLQADQLIDTTIGDITPEANTTYSLTFYTGATVAHKVTGLTTNHYTWNDETDLCLMQFEQNVTDAAGNEWFITGTPVYVDGKVEHNAIRFNSANGLICLTQNNEAIFDFADNTDFTIECWVRVIDNASHYGCILASNRNSFDSSARFLMFKGADVYPTTQRNRIVFGGQPYIDQTIVQSTTALNLNDWYHVAVTRLGNVYKLFLNGQLQSQTTINTPINFSAGGTLLGRNKWDGNNGLFKGDIDQFRISKGCLYLDNFTPSTKPYEFNQGGVLNKEITIELEAQRDGLTSYQKHDFSFKVGG